MLALLSIKLFYSLYKINYVYNYYNNIIIAFKVNLKHTILIEVIWFCTSSWLDEVSKIFTDKVICRTSALCSPVHVYSWSSTNHQCGVYH